MVTKKDLVNLNVRIPATLKKLIDKYVQCDIHTNASEFTRDALREKLAKDAPELYAQLFKEIPAMSGSEKAAIHG
jgi:Arc/MetJ-type ribon-helix-helix transcriptional regulator